MKSQQISMYTGTIHPSMTGIIHWQNGQNQLNRKVQYYNGVGLSTVHRGLDEELTATSDEHLLGKDHTNGMQFEPSVDISKSVLSQIKILDASNLLLSSYNETSQNYKVHHEITIVQYNSSDLIDGSGRY